MLTNASYSSMAYLVDGAFVWQMIDIVLYWIGANIILGLFNNFLLDRLMVEKSDWNNGVWWGFSWSSFHNHDLFDDTLFTDDTRHLVSNLV